METIDWILLKIYPLKDAVLFVLIPVFLGTLGWAIYLTRKASLDRIPRD